jgi:hypothetical protein
MIGRGNIWELLEISIFSGFRAHREKIVFLVVSKKWAIFSRESLKTQSWFLEVPNHHE